MITDEIKSEVAELANLPIFRLGSFGNRDKDLIYCIWIARISISSLQPSYVFSIHRKETVQTGFITKKYNEQTVIQTLKRDDPVIKNIQSINLLPSDFRPSFDDLEDLFEFHITTWHFTADLWVGPNPTDNSLAHLLHSILEISEIATNTPELKEENQIIRNALKRWTDEMNKNK